MDYSFKAEPFLCVAATLQKVIFDLTNSYFEQNVIADYFGVNFPTDYEIINVTNYKITEDSSKWGIVLAKESINGLFAALRIPLKEQYYPINTYDEYSFNDFIRTSLNDETRIICGFSLSTLYNLSDLNENIGHVSIIDSINFDASKIVITDLNPENFGQRVVDAFDLFRAVLKKKDGFWVISKVT